MARKTINFGIGYETVLTVPAHLVAPLTDILLECSLDPNRWSKDVDIRVAVSEEPTSLKTATEMQEEPIPHAEGSVAPSAHHHVPEAVDGID